jgi:thiosulfate reductase cytochrome b subunit
MVVFISRLSNRWSWDKINFGVSLQDGHGQIFMSTTSSAAGHQVSTEAVSIALLVVSAVWLVSVAVYYATSGFRVNWSATPLFWMLLVMVTPSICFSAGLILKDARKRSPFSRLTWCAVAAGVLPMTFGTGLAVWAMKGLRSMSGVGI